MKPRLSYAATFGDTRWMEAFAKVKEAGEGAKVKAGGVEYTLYWISDDPPWVQLRDAKGVKRMVRKGDVLMLELQPQEQLNDTQWEVT